MVADFGHPRHVLLKARQVDHIVDIGAGIRPVDFFQTKTHICIEPSPEYAKVLREHGYEVIQKKAIDADIPDTQAVFLVDVIEHMHKEEALEVLEKAKHAAISYVFVFTPYGFMEQTSDNWGYGEHSLQTHRSGWTEEDFPGWVCTTNKVRRTEQVKYIRAIYEK